jgi:hypothetical protein
MSASAQPQNIANHARYVPGFHFITGFLVIANLGYSLYKVVRLPSGTTADGVMIAVILMLLFFYLRAFPIAVQDRLIRLEERLRLARLLPADMQSRCDEFTAEQLIGLRFASDAELPALAKRVLAESIASRGAVKKMIREWRPDYMRA